MKISDKIHQWYKTGNKPSGLYCVAYQETKQQEKVAWMVWNNDKSNKAAYFFGFMMGIIFSKREEYYDDQMENIN